MNSLNQSELRELTHTPGNRFVSIYMPTESPSRESPQNLIRYRGLLDTAETILVDKGMSKSDARRFLEPARELEERPLFWSGLAHGLAVLLSEGGIRVWHLPYACEAQCFVGKRFHLLPLLALTDVIASHWLLLLSQNCVRLLHGTPGELREVTVPELPGTRQSVSRPRRNVAEDSFQIHSGNPQLRGKEGLVFTGQGGSADVAGEEVAAFVDAVEAAVTKFLKTRAEPLIVVGDDSLVAAYRRRNHYQGLVDSHVSGNPDLYSAAELKQRTQPILAKLLKARRDEAVAGYWDRVGHSRVANRVEEILAAAESGAVETLFVDPAAHRLGLFRQDAEIVRFDGAPRHDSEDLVNLATALVLQHDGRIVVPEAGNVPGGGPMAVTLRHPLPAQTIEVLV